MNKAYDRYDDKVRIYSFKTNETIQIETKNTNMAYIYNLSREKLEKGILVLDENGQMLPDQIISVTFQTPENSSFNEIRLEFEYRPMPEVIYKNIATIYYVYLPAKVFVEYVYNDVIYYELYPFNNSTNLIITNPK